MHALLPQQAGQRQGQYSALVEAAFAYRVGLADFIQAQVALAPVHVPGQRLHQTQQARGAQHGGLFRDGVAQARQLFAGRQEFLRVLGVDGRKADHFVEALRFQRPPQRGFRLGVGPEHHRLARGRQASGELVIAVVTSQFFDQVNLAADVPPPGGRGHPPGILVGAGGHKAQRGQKALDQGRGQRLAQSAQDFPLAKRDFGHVPAAGVDVNDTGEQFAAGQLQEEFRAATRRAHRRFHVQAALEAGAGFRAQAQVFRRPASSHRFEPGRLEQDVLGAQADLRRRPAQDAGQGHRALGVGDDEMMRLQGARDAVEGGDFLARLGGPHHDALLGQGVEVEGVRGVAEFEQDVVGDVHDVVDGSNPAGFQALPQPLGRGLHLEVAEDQGCVAVAQVGRLDLHLGGAGGQVAHFHRLGLNGLERFGVERADLAGHAVVAHQVGPVGGDFQLQQGPGLGLAQPLHRHPRQGQIRGKLLRRHAGVDVFFQPLEQDLHRVTSCAPKSG